MNFKNRNSTNDYLVYGVISYLILGLWIFGTKAFSLTAKEDLARLMLVLKC